MASASVAVKKQRKNLKVVQPDLTTVKFPTPMKEYRDVSISIELIEPETAVKWLAQNFKNRTVSRGTVEAYGRDMVNGDWELSDSCICFDVNENLINGQHRLQACVQSNISFYAFVARGMPITTYRVLDIGRKRTLGNLLHMEGHKQPTIVPAAARWLLKLKEGKSTQSGRRKLSHAEIRRVVEAHEGLESSAHRTWNAFGLKPSLLTAVHYITSELIGEQDLANDFVSVFVKGESFYKGDAAKAWRERLIRMKENYMRLKDTDLLFGTAHAWNKFRKQEPVLTFKIPDDTSFDGLDTDKI
jgi:hypothetical protein